MNHYQLNLLIKICFLLFVIIIQVNCSTFDLAEHCASIEEKSKLSKKDLETTCWYNEVYRYNNETYTICNCCDCDKAPMAFNCNIDPLCEWDDDCLDDFFKNADLIGYVEF